MTCWPYVLGALMVGGMVVTVVMSCFAAGWAGAGEWAGGGEMKPRCPFCGMVLTDGKCPWCDYRREET